MTVVIGRGSFARDQRPHYVYQFWDRLDQALYIGMTASPSGRIAAHTAQPWWPRVDHFSADVYPCRGDALDAEARLIEQHQPLFNFYHSKSAAGSRSGHGPGGSAWTKADRAPRA